MRRNFWWWVALVLGVAILWMALRSNEAVTRTLLPLTSSPVGEKVGTHLLISIWGNICVFVPLGMAVALALSTYSRRWVLLWGTLAGFGLSASVELAQLFIPSRYTDWRDLWLNTLGALLGAVAGVVLAMLFPSIRISATSEPGD
ncbi:MAG TPA: VanZ family protein [Thermoflexia bacterium]|nr:VanZ family protein [Thermoflexia bacterium]